MRIGPVLVSAVALALVLAACRGPDTASSGSPGDGRGTPAALGALRVQTVAGPTCPVERQPPDPSCAPRPVTGARVVVIPADGSEILVASGTTDERGMLLLQVEAGDYLVGASEVEGMRGAPQGIPAHVVAGQTSAVTLEFDTGIR